MLILISIVHILVTACMCCLLWDATRPGEALGFWSVWIEKTFYSDHPLLEKFLGGCMKCFSHLISILGFPVFLLIEWKLGLWVGWWNIPIYFILIPLSIILAQIIFGTIKRLNQ